MSITNSVLITGGTGFVGSWMRKYKPDGVHITYTGTKGYENHSCFTQKYDYIVHLAPVSPSIVIDVARDNNARLLYCSSGAVYHPENDTEYRRNKMRWEQECLDSGVDVVIARLFTFMDSSIMWRSFFTAARTGKPLEVWGECTRSFMHGSELAHWMWAILLQGETGQAYDVGSDMPVTNLRLAERISSFTGCEIKHIDKDVPVPVYLPPNTERTRELL